MDSEKKYIAKKRLRIGGGYRNIGEPVPEANSWPNLQDWLNNEYVEEVEEDTKPLVNPIVRRPTIELAEEDKTETKEEITKEVTQEKPQNYSVEKFVAEKKGKKSKNGYVCDICERKFDKESSLKRHKTRSH